MVSTIPKTGLGWAFGALLALGVFGADRNILQASGFDPATSQVLYRVSPNFGREDVLCDKASSRST